MNIYRQRFTAPCCNNGLTVIYELDLRTKDDVVVMVEDIQAACIEAATLPKPYHENIADLMFERFGGFQIIKAHHHGTDIETRRGT